MAEKLTINQKNYLTEIDKIFFSDGYNLATEFLKEGISRENLLAMSREIYDSMDQLTEAFVQRCIKEDRTVECKKGCYLCCCQAVFVVPYELLCMVRFIKENITKKDRTAILARAKEKDECTGKMKVQEFLHFKSPCPLLENGVCFLYDARPMACRTYLSSRVDGCIEEYHNPRDVEIYPDLYDFTIRAGRMINEGICNFLLENNIPSPEWPIESALLTAFEDNEAFDKWLAGENIFQKRDYTIEELAYIDNFGIKKKKAESS